MMEIVSLVTLCVVGCFDGRREVMSKSCWRVFKQGFKQGFAKTFWVGLALTVGLALGSFSPSYEVCGTKEISNEN